MLEDAKPPAKQIPDNFFTQLFTKGIITAETATRALPFVLFLSLLGMIYIANMNLAEKNIRDIDKIGKEVKELSYDYKTYQSRVGFFKSTLTEVAKQCRHIRGKGIIAAASKNN